MTVVAPKNYEQRVAAGFAVTDAVTGELLGACGLAAVDASTRRSGAGYWVAPWGRGRGVATSALGLVSAWALQPARLRSIRMEIEPENLALAAVALRAGYRRLDLPPLTELHRGESEIRVFDLYERSIAPSH